MSDIEIQQIVFQGDGLVIAYQDMDDIREKGAVVMQRTIRLDASHPDYGEDIDALHRKAVKVLANALEDFEASTERGVPADDDDDDEDERGMGS